MKMAKNRCNNAARRVWTLRKWVLLGILALTAGGIICSYVLAGLSMDANAGVTEQLIMVFGGAFVGYLLADTADHYSLNKTGAQIAPEEDDTEGDEEND